VTERRRDDILRDIESLVDEWYEADESSDFIPGQTAVPYAGRVFDASEIKAAVKSSLEFWLTLGPYGRKLEAQLAEYVNVKHASLVNSGSSANLLALAALTSPKLDNPLQAGDEVITSALGFPTTVNPIYQYGMSPVYVDAEPGTYVPSAEQVGAAVSDKTRAVFLAHTLGNPFDIDGVKEICREHGLFLIEDNCDSLGSLYKGKRTGSFGDLATSSFYPPHHMTMGEGGAVMTSNTQLKQVVESFRDWGRDCWCPSGKDDTCAKRFQWQLGDLPKGYDHKYIYSHIGYNLKPLDIQAAIGLKQLDKLPVFEAARRRNFKRLSAVLAPYSEFLVLPQATAESDPCWFGFLIVIKDEAPFRRDEFVAHLEKDKIQTRMLFGGNLTRQPAYLDKHHRVSGSLVIADQVMRDGFFIGVYPGLTQDMLDYMETSLTGFLERK
jgi:CDP-6-deoxy-D-xylo-4-hexulose-3-dehydrase